MHRVTSRAAALGLLLATALCQGGRADEAAAGRSPGATAPPAAEPLRRAPSAAYYALRPGVPARSGPSRSAPAVSTLPAAGKPLQALGMALDGGADAPEGEAGDPALARLWIKLRLPSGGAGFVSLDDLITPQQAEARAGSLRKVGLFDAQVAEAKRIRGPDMPSGIYTRGGSCDAPESPQADVGAFLQTKVLIWQDGPKMHFVRVLRPDDPTVYDIGSDGHVEELRGFGYVPMRTFRSPKDAVLMGFKDRRLWFSADGQTFNSYEACDPALIDTAASMLRAYAGQRPPDAR